MFVLNLKILGLVVRRKKRRFVHTHTHARTHTHRVTEKTKPIYPLYHVYTSFGGSINRIWHFMKSVSKNKEGHDMPKPTLYSGKKKKKRLKTINLNQHR